MVPVSKAKAAWALSNEEMTAVLFELETNMRHASTFGAILP